ncbi:AMP-binding enzyme [Paradesulfitobacterium ferrireducens]|uniref:AMP-binding enzyme n=1 Tax=Paradesulfitobacterium ferrireducens TaxID=2816476 RepID=UPI001A8F076F|nr:acyl-CoA synthetase [Paradesulfitobacterium ferrireducens]
MGTCMGAVLQDEMGQLDGRQRDGIMLEQYISYARIESALLEFPGVLEAGVISECRYRQQPLLKVFLALDEDEVKLIRSRLDESRLSDFVREVQEYLREQFNFGIALKIKVSVRDKLPMTRSGKILRNVLSEWE